MYRSPLFDIHKTEGGKLAPFAGWEMPIEYSGILAEHEEVRTNAGLFDLSHMGELELSGNNALTFIDSLITNNAQSLQVWQICYTVACNENGKVLDDFLLYKLPDKIILVVNALNKEKMCAWIKEHLPHDVTLEDKTFDTALLAVQGPKAQEMLQPFIDFSLDEIHYYWSKKGLILGTDVLISRTGYTGEDGFELYIKWEDALKIWKKLRETGIPPIGLGARDTLRLESCYSLYGHEINESRSPLEAGLGWVVRFNKDNFIGKETLLKEKKLGHPFQLVAFKMLNKTIPRQGYNIKCNYPVNNESLGIVTSGSYSPTLKIGVGMGYLPSSFDAKPDAPIEVEIRGTWQPAVLVQKPLYRGTVKLNPSKN